jgi:hypothetical protein
MAKLTVKPKKGGKDGFEAKLVSSKVLGPRREG